MYPWDSPEATAGAAQRDTNKRSVQDQGIPPSLHPYHFQIRCSSHSSHLDYFSFSPLFLAAPVSCSSVPVQHLEVVRPGRWRWNCRCRERLEVSPFWNPADARFRSSQVRSILLFLFFFLFFLRISALKTGFRFWWNSYFSLVAELAVVEFDTVILFTG